MLNSVLENPWGTTWFCLSNPSSSGGLACQGYVQYIPQNMHTFLHCFVLVFSCSVKRINPWWINVIHLLFFFCVAPLSIAQSYDSPSGWQVKPSGRIWMQWTSTQTQKLRTTRVHDIIHPRQQLIRNLLRTLMVNRPFLQFSARWRG